MLQIYNTLTGKKENFQPLQKNKINLYVCGVTVYDFCHLGHARTYTALDVIVRYLRFLNYDVCYVRNITDIDDKIIKRAQESNITYQEITTHFTKAMHEDFAALNLVAPNAEPYATDFIPHMISLIEKMMQNNYAYQASNGDIYFNVRSDKNYGCLSHHDLEQLESGSRVDIVEEKKDPLDFVLWKKSKANEPFWESPWGKGRPGWHIECSAMAIHLLGEDFDIHAGGRDLIFPHHENELAQAKAASPGEFARFWLHTGFLQIDKEKMSKSLGNFVTIRDALKIHSGEVLRYFFVASHYRSPLVYTDDALHQARQALARLYNALRFLPVSEKEKNSNFEQQFIAALSDDFNTPIALSILFNIAHEIQRLKHVDLNKAASLGALLKELANVFGLLQNDPETFFTSATADVDKITQLIAEREEARKNKAWAQADQIRQQLLNMGISIEDSPQGTTWKNL